MPVLSQNQRGALYMTISMLAFLINDSCLKALSDELPLMQAITLRGLGSTILLAVYVLATGGVRLRLPLADWVRIVIRTACEAAAAFLFITALYHMPIANVTAIMQALPLAVTLAAALFLGERVGWRRMSAIVVGFFGVLLIVRPGPEGFNAYAIYALISVAAVVLRDLVTRRLSEKVESMTVALATGIGVTIFGLVGSFGLEGPGLIASRGLIGALGATWEPVSPLAWAQMTLAVVAVILGYLFSILTMRTGEIGFTAPFRYTGLVFALISGLLVFGEVPDALTLAGSAIVVGAGMFTLYRERARPVAAGQVPVRPS